MLFYEELLNVLDRGRTGYPDLPGPVPRRAPRYVHYEKRELPLIRAALRKAQIYVLSTEAQRRARRDILWEPSRLWAMLSASEMPFDMLWIEEAPEEIDQTYYGYLVQRQADGLLVTTFEGSRSFTGELCVGSNPFSCRLNLSNPKLWDASPLSLCAREVWPKITDMEQRLGTTFDVPGSQSWLAFSAALHDTWLSRLDTDELARTIFNPVYEVPMRHAFSRMCCEPARLRLVPVGMPTDPLIKLISGKGAAQKLGRSASPAWAAEGFDVVGDGPLHCWRGLAAVLLVSAETGVDRRARPSAAPDGRSEECRSPGGIMYRNVTIDPDKPRVVYLPDDEGDDSEAEDSKSQRALHQVRGTWMVHPTKRGNPDCTDWCEPAVWTDSRGKFRWCRRCGKQATWRMPHERGDRKRGEVVRIRNVKPSA
jgi:hypothetical protein